MCVSEKNCTPTTSLGESFLPFVRFVLSFFPNDCHPNRRNLNTSTAVYYRKSVIINDNSRWFQQTCISSCQPEMPVTSKLVKKMEVWMPVGRAGTAAVHRVLAASQMYVYTDYISQTAAGKGASPQHKYGSAESGVCLCKVPDAGYLRVPSTNTTLHVLQPHPVSLLMWKRKQNPLVFKLNFAKEQKETRRWAAWIGFVQTRWANWCGAFSPGWSVLVIMGYKVHVKPPSLCCNHLMGFDLLPRPACSESTFSISALLLFH